MQIFGPLLLKNQCFGIHSKLVLGTQITLIIVFLRSTQILIMQLFILLQNLINYHSYAQLAHNRQHFIYHH